MKPLIYKYTIMPGDKLTLHIPREDIVVHVGKDTRSDDPAMWIMHRPGGVAVDRTFYVVPTGHRFDGSYKGTAICGEFAWHIAEAV